MGIEVITGILVLLLGGATVVGAAIALVGLLTGERFARCVQCHHVGISVRGEVHRSGCPTTAREQFAHLVQHVPHLHHS